MSSSEFECVSRDLVQPRRSWDNLPVVVDWHDFLRKQRPRGTDVALNYTFRFPRKSEYNKGLQFRCTTAGRSSGADEASFRWPDTANAVVKDGTAVWTAEPISPASLETTISVESWPAVTDLTLSNQVNADLRYQTDNAGGVSGKVYEIAHRAQMANGWKKEWIVVQPVQD